MPRSASTEYSSQWVDQAQELKRVVQAVGEADQVYLDLEADSMHHYFAKVCLMQILAGGVCYIVDPLAGLDLKPLLSALARKPLVMHGADYDLRMLYQQYKFRPARVFDTMIAAQLLGRSAFGLAALVREFFDVALGKEAQKADWSRRPLTEAMLQYAAQDTYFLPDLHAGLKADLEDKGRLNWHRECCETLVRATERIRENDPDAAWRLAGSSKHTPRQLAALKSLWSFRESAARALDVPGYKILPSEILVRFAEGVPPTGTPDRLPKLPSRLEPSLREGFLRAFETALQADAKDWPKPLAPARRPIKSPHPDLLAELRKIRDRVASGLNLDPSLIAPRAMLLAVALTGLRSTETVREAARWMSWQEELLLEPWIQAARPYQKLK